MRDFICCTCSEIYTEIELEHSGSVCDACGSTGFKLYNDNEEDKEYNDGDNGFN